MKDIDWGKVRKGQDYVVQDSSTGDVLTCSQDFLNLYKDGLTILAKRPKPPLTKEQIEAVRELCEWANGCDDLVDTWLKQRGGE